MKTHEQKNLWITDGRDKPKKKTLRPSFALGSPQRPYLLMEILNLIVKIMTRKVITVIVADNNNEYNYSYNNDDDNDDDNNNNNNNKKNNNNNNLISFQSQD